MKTVVVNNQKGGVGKTTLAAHIGWYLAETGGARVLMVDTDAQGNLSSVIQNGKILGDAGSLFTEEITPVPAEPGLGIYAVLDKQRLRSAAETPQASVAFFRRNIQVLAPYYDYCVIDTPPIWGPMPFAALSVATGMIGPIDLGQFAIDGTKELLQQLQLINTQLRSDDPVRLFGILVSRFQSGVPQQKDTLANLVDAYGATILFPGVVTQRQSYGDAANLKIPVWAMKPTAARAAAKEIRDILDRLKEMLDATGEHDDDEAE